MGFSYSGSKPYHDNLRPAKASIGSARLSDYIIGSEVVYDLEEIWDSIGQDSKAAADRWIAKLLSAF